MNFSKSTLNGPHSKSATDILNKGGNGTSKSNSTTLSYAYVIPYILLYASYLATSILLAISCSHSTLAVMIHLSHLMGLVTWTCAIHPQLEHPESTYMNLPTMDVYPLTYLVFSSYMMSMSFVATLLGSSVLTYDNFHTLRWWRKQRVYPRPPSPEPPDDPSDFMPKRSRGKHGPSRCLLRLALLSSIAISDTIPDIDLKIERSIKRDLIIHQNARGFLVNDRLKPSDLDRLCVVLEAGKCHLIKKHDHF